MITVAVAGVAEFVTNGRDRGTNYLCYGPSDTGTRALVGEAE